MIINMPTIITQDELDRMYKTALEVFKSNDKNHGDAYNRDDHNFTFRVYPYTTGGTNAFGGIGGQTITTHTMYAIVDELIVGDAVLFLYGRPKYVKRFKPEMGWND